ncbi:hypothetical protein D3C71_1593680 [compost metagenome]
MMSINEQIISRLVQHPADQNPHQRTVPHGNQLLADQTLLIQPTEGSDLNRRRFISGSFVNLGLDLVGGPEQVELLHIPGQQIIHFGDIQSFGKPDKQRNIIGGRTEQAAAHNSFLGTANRG